MALSSRWVDRIFARLLVRYGSAWLRQWEGLEIEAVKTDWAEVMAGYDARPDDIAYALEHLPAEKPPATAVQFRALCNAAPPPVFKALPLPQRDPAKARAAVDAIKNVLAPPGDRLAWAKKLRDDESAGVKLTEAQRLAWRGALSAINEHPTTPDQWSQQ